MARRHRFEIADIAVAGDQHPVGGDRAAARFRSASCRRRSADRRWPWSSRRARRPPDAAARARPISSFSGWIWPVPVSRTPQIVAFRAQPLLRFRRVHEMEVRIAVALGGDLGILGIVALDSSPCGRRSSAPACSRCRSDAPSAKLQQMMLGALRPDRTALSSARSRGFLPAPPATSAGRCRAGRHCVPMRRRRSGRPRSARHRRRL